MHIKLVCSWKLSLLRTQYNSNEMVEKIKVKIGYLLYIFLEIAIIIYLPTYLIICLCIYVYPCIHIYFVVIQQSKYNCVSLRFSVTCSLSNNDVTLILDLIIFNSFCSLQIILNCCLST